MRFKFKIRQTVTGISSSNELDEASPPPIIEEVEEITEAPIVYKGLAEPGEPELGPKLFYDGKDFLMKLGGPIRVTIFSGPAKGDFFSEEGCCVCQFFKQTNLIIFLS